MAVSESPPDYEALIQKAKDVAPPGPSVPLREDWVAVDEIEYPRFQMVVDLTSSGEVWEIIEDTAVTKEARARALGQIVTKHNEWCDPKGLPYPQPTEPMFWSAIPQRLYILIVRRLYQVVRGPSRLLEAPASNGRGR